jgi:hypothetical protein
VCHICENVKELYLWRLLKTCFRISERHEVMRLFHSCLRNWNMFHSQVCASELGPLASWPNCKLLTSATVVSWERGDWDMASFWPNMKQQKRHFQFHSRDHVALRNTEFSRAAEFLLSLQRTVAVREKMNRCEKKERVSSGNRFSKHFQNKTPGKLGDCH